MLVFGRGVAQDSTQAVGWFRKAADQGFAAAQYNLGVAYREGQGIEKNLDTAFQWFQKSADQGHAEAQFNVGFFYANGQVVAKNPEQAAAWYRKSADQLYPPAQLNLGRALYTRGRRPAGPDPAVDWFLKAAKGNLPQGREVLNRLAPGDTLPRRTPWGRRLRTGGVAWDSIQRPCAGTARVPCRATLRRSAIWGGCMPPAAACRRMTRKLACGWNGPTLGVTRRASSPRRPSLASGARGIVRPTRSHQTIEPGSGTALGAVSIWTCAVKES